MPNNFYPDSNFYQRLTKRGNELHWNEFIDECEAHKIDIPQECDPLFTVFLLLERIGLGGVLKSIQRSPAYKALITLIHAYIKGMPDPKKLDDKDLERLQREIANLLDGMGETFYALLRLSPELELSSLLRRLDEEIAVYATSSAAGDLLKPTLLRVRQFFADHPEDGIADIIGRLGWNLLVTFPYIEPDQISVDGAEMIFEKAVLWFNSLFAVAHAEFIKGKSFGLFRLAEARCHAYTKIIAKDPNNPQFATAKAWAEGYKPLRRRDDLCDGELIDFAVLGLEGKKVICFTSDSQTDIGNRLALLKGMLVNAARDVEGWSIQPCYGRVYCVSENSQPLKIVHSFVLDTAPP